ncbi:MAG: NAD(P)-dependent oxidoreductase [Acetobacteraceae bacterium]|nr:NAD(P)-dependent oxidoreductase [Acetobacteraceae bacterium]
MSGAAVGAMRVGFIGLGAMGLPMAVQLVRAGFTVTGFDLRSEAMEALVAAGGAEAASAADAARDAQALVLMVVNSAQAEAALFDQGAVAAMAPRGIVVLMATCAPAVVRAIAARIEAAQRRFVDAPVSGGVRGASTGTLTIMAAAEQDTFDAARPLLDRLGDKLFHLGEAPGQGAMAKVVNQLLCGVHIAAAAEALAFAEAAGLDAAAMLEIVGASAAGSWMLRDRGPRMLEAAPAVASAVDIFVKDLGLVLEAGRGAKAATPLAALAHQMFLAASGRGEGAADDSQVIGSWRVLNRAGDG